MESLDSLLKEALKHELNSRRGEGSIRRLAAIQAACHSAYSNPDNWTAARTISLVHVESGETLGLFQEYCHNRSNARKLVRIESGDAAAVERVSGPEWLGGYVHKVDPPTEGELAHIRAAWKPKMWRPAWKHLRTRTSDELLGELIG